MRVLVTGGTGFIGRNLIPHLLTQNHDLVLLLNEKYSSGDATLPPELTAIRQHVQTVYADLRNYKLTARAIREAQPTHVIHLAAAGVTNPFLGLNEALRHNLHGTLNVARACFERGGNVERMIVARTPGELTHMNMYATSKAAAWDFCQMYAKTHQWPIMGAMIFQAYGYGQAAHTLIPSAARAALAGEDFPMTAGEQQKDWIAVSDVAAGLSACLTPSIPHGTTIDLGTGTSVSVAIVVKKLYDVANRGGSPNFGALPQRKGEAVLQVANIVNTQAFINWHPLLSLDQGLEQYLKLMAI